MLIPINSRSDLKLGHIGSKDSSLYLIIEKHCVHSRGHIMDPKFLKLLQNVCPHNMWVKFEIG